VAPRQLVLAGFFIDLGADPGHRLLDLDARGRDIGQQRAGERAVGSDLAVERGLPGAGGEGDQGALAGFHFRKAGLHIDTAGCLGGTDLCRERVVAASVQKHQFDLGVGHGLLQRDVDIDGAAQLDVHFGFEIGVDRQQIVGAVDGDAVAGIEEQRDVGAFGLLAKLEQPLRHLVAGEVSAFHDVETDIAQELGHRLGIDRRIGKRRHVLVGAVADHEGDALVGEGRIGAEQKCCH
jgi:hypothetical protein